MLSIPQTVGQMSKEGLRPPSRPEVAAVAPHKECRWRAAGGRSLPRDGPKADAQTSPSLPDLRPRAARPLAACATRPAAPLLSRAPPCLATPRPCPEHPPCAHRPRDRIRRIHRCRRLRLRPRRPRRRHLRHLRQIELPNYILIWKSLRQIELPTRLEWPAAVEGACTPSPSRTRDRRCARRRGRRTCEWSSHQAPQEAAAPKL